ncbi:MAG: IS66 family insertion sequence element accessory protein TnpB [Oscillospiraceae bacterium]|nr:IS66 family insertion sequence element accessory protein TnpB [Oscillospiraceae bacterium]
MICKRIACGYTDLRRGIDGLAELVRQQFQLSFLFRC